MIEIGNVNNNDCVIDNRTYAYVETYGLWRLITYKDALGEDLYAQDDLNKLIKNII